MNNKIKENKMNNLTGFMRLPEVLELIPISKSSWWLGIKNGRYPKAVKLGERTTAWRTADIQNLLNSFNE